MHQTAVFVDAGYLYAQASILLTGNKQPRLLMSLDGPAIVAALTALALDKSGGRLLRIYWYDGSPYGNPTPDQARIADLDYVRLRLGVVNNVGEQKGVDALIMTDMMELARNHAISDALLLSGDEDLRLGVHLAQSFGVRVHLLGIAPARESQSSGLRRDADTTSEWTEGVMRSLVGFREIEPTSATTAPEPSSSSIASAAVLPNAEPLPTLKATVPQPVVREPASEEALRLLVARGLNGDTRRTDPIDELKRVARQIASRLTTYERTEVIEELSLDMGIPHFWDKQLLTIGGDAVGGELEIWQKRLLRDAFVDYLHPES